MTHIHAVLLGIVEGITEFLPISSTAHLDIARTILGIATSDFIKSFEIVIQLGAILAVIALYAKTVFSSWRYVRNIIIAFIPTGLIGFVLYKVIKAFLIGNTLLAASALIIGGCIILWLEKREERKNITHKSVQDTKTIETLSLRELLILGVAQAIAVIPGVSRSGAVIVAGRLLSIPTVVITEFSFLLAVPTMAAATFYDLLKSGISFSGNEWGIVGIGFLVSGVVAFFTVKTLVTYVQNHSFKVFGWYRIILGILVIIFLLA